MERRFDMSDFEQSLKDHADQFKLIPSKRVWNGIYNNLHPGSKWPSISVAIIFLITLITIGSLNNSPVGNKANVFAAINSEIQATGNSLSSGHNEIEKNNVEKKSTGQGFEKTDRALHNTSTGISSEKNISSKEKTPADRSVNENRSALNVQHFPSKTNAPVVKLYTGVSKNINQVLEKTSSSFLKPTGNSKSNINNETTAFSDLDNEITFIQYPFISFENNFAIPVANEKALYPDDASFKNFDLLNAPFIPKDTRLNSENKEIAKKPLKKKKNAEWTFYLTPLISNVSFDKKTIRPTSQNVSSIVVLANQAPSEVHLMHNAGFGLEAGADVAFYLSKKLKFVTGGKFNYSSYNHISNYIHPTFATLILNDKAGAYAQNYVTHYGNGQSNSRVPLTNYTLEAAIPLGLQYIVWKNGKIQIDLASAIEPSAILKGNAFIISSNGGYYINDASLIRTLNLAANFGSYITFSGRKIKWHIGPDFRYQLLSTYKNIYGSKEHFLDYGIRIGISK
jgi:hypothetical protein